MSIFNFNPSYSVISSIKFVSSNGSVDDLDITKQNEECVFERIEFVENANDVFPNGVLIVKDTKDIITSIDYYQFTSLEIKFINTDDPWIVDITSVSYINNAASDTEENFVGIYFTNKYYKKALTTSLNDEYPYISAIVHRIKDFVNILRTDILDRDVVNDYNDEATNYVLYRPVNTLANRTEAVSDNAIEYLNYLTTAAISKDTNLPTFMFWTDFDGSINFKSFKYDVTNEPIIHKFAIFDGDSVFQKLSDDEEYKKIYFYNTDPAFQYISKNYYYIRKTPKVLDEIPEGLCSAPNSSTNKLTTEKDEYINSNLMYQFQDEGQRYNIELIGSSGTNFASPGSDQLVYPYHWGYYDSLDSIDSFTQLTLLGQKFGTSDSFKSMNFMGSSGYMTYVDNTEMWKNIFDLTPIHPDYPNTGDVYGLSTNLQKIINLRFKAFAAAGISGDEHLDYQRKMELQNFISYSLCCMGDDHDCFFAVLQRYEVDSTKTFPATVKGKSYRYKWNKLIFEGTGSAPSGSAGATTFHQVEGWSYDVLRSSLTQDRTWAINLNERGLTPGYLPPGWVNPTQSGFSYRPIGASGSSPIAIGTAGNIFHIAKICKYTDGDNYVYYFTAENVVDGTC